MNAAIRSNRMVLEESPEYFWERFSQYAQTWPVSPEPLGSPLLEVLTPLGPLFAFDRTVVPFSGDETPLIFHGQVEHWEATQNTNALQHLGGGRYRMTGRVEAVLDATFFVLQVPGQGGEIALQLVLAAPNPPGVGSWITVQLNPPLMVFRPDSSSR
ncbi:MAG: hypothetical protein KatS3mg074_053 [Meiothermus sp.]|uniref:Uncharacterized protein n=2 Tax=Meiothermus hypogaeus TaxID=884155 RepID=A0A511R4F6_9DEIN|nr:hypothetical protein [Meiothermus hypogaeus]RIH80176.1 hypothetical protein Mhypo_00800 [Meiothermus hypogaeus]GEM84503.1 hypothetical protein MHY01S_26690 [Meiothermus hypogaeus NBRC 106114]GIW37655.1 MAG: hypothetical protein KatS3mg074_053 [Meiothermus sp.]